MQAKLSSRLGCERCHPGERRNSPHCFYVLVKYEAKLSAESEEGDGKWLGNSAALLEGTGGHLKLLDVNFNETGQRGWVFLSRYIYQLRCACQIGR